jgi:hypothetical protein
MTEQLDLTLAPGCFGLAMTFKAAARECQACPFASACQPRAEANLAALRRELGIEPPPAPKKVMEKLVQHTVNEVTIDATTPKKVMSHLDRLERLKIAVKPALARGENPFKKGDKTLFMRVACHALLKLREGVRRDFLVTCFMQKLGHTRKTAESHATQAIQILTSIGAATETGGLVQLTRQ